MLWLLLMCIILLECSAASCSANVRFAHILPSLYSTCGIWCIVVLWHFRCLKQRKYASFKALYVDMMCVCEIVQENRSQKWECKKNEKSTKCWVIKQGTTHWVSPWVMPSLILNAKYKILKIEFKGPTHNWTRWLVMSTNGSRWPIPRSRVVEKLKGET